ncbi:type I polyketide synthase [Puniceicoccus vermicola]|uniref:SDR family NAD(P)-dependent oxidoreductase n=1 Tax=Puniceicoccus vermicola TaxID=388746 RepID=A0A7X1E589_9BACT|nr:type I polyketide synthase [Puniceicoccus vermicola]MBC2601357.1 SDR family NAD(P)-dependent oxidoreductase [Puniceicoccus vermicola]
MPQKIAIIGIGLRLPPTSESPDTFWKFLCEAGDAIAPVPSDRWDLRRFYDPDPARPGKTYVARGGFLQNDVRRFDPMAFGISPREANGIDPQQRLLMESAWETFEDAGIPLERIENSRTGVFLGGFCLDHLLQISQPANRTQVSSHSATSGSMTILANRLSYVFNLRGPSFTLDTACSSSLVALHCACRSIENGECELALAGGSNVMMRPEYPIMMSKGHFLSDHGNCRTFDTTAAGYARGEGAAMVLLKPLDKAIADGDAIHAVICGSGINQDGRTSGISLPNSEAQESLMREVYENAGVAPGSVDYVEAHGTGTQAGDPAEARALDAVFREGRSNPLTVGSVKTNIGHLEAAAGIAGIIKTALILRHRKVPQNLHFQNPNPKIPFDEYCLKVPEKSEALPTFEEKAELFAGVNSFGYGGTNAHIILSSPPAPTPATQNPDNETPRIFPFSARSPEALRETASRLAFTIRRRKDLQLDDLYHSLTERRSHLSHRGAIIASSAQDLRSKLMAASTGEESPEIRLSGETASPAKGPVFVCTGMGPQWWAMGRELFEKEPICRETLDEIDASFQRVSGWSIAEAMLASEADSRMTRTEVAQPANFVLQVALARLWQSWGIEPSAIVGHSVGEVSAAYLSGVHTLEEAVAVSYHRSRLQQQEAGKGKMLAVGLSEEGVAPYLEGVEGVSVAAINSFASVTLSGDSEALQSIASRLEEESLFHKFLRVEVAYHSPQMEPLRDELLSSLESLSPKSPKIPLISTVSGDFSDGSEWTADYWWKNVRQPVRFAAATATLLDKEFGHFLEVGPHPVLGNSIREVAADRGHAIHLFPSIRRKEAELATMRTSLADLYDSGISPDWKALSPSSGRFVRLPSYPWQRQSYWSETPEARMDRLGLPGPIYQNQKIHAAHPTWEVEINRGFFPFLPDHGVQNQVVFPGMGYIEAALLLNQSVHGTRSCVLSDVDFEKFLIVESERLQHLVSSLDPETRRFEIASRVQDELESHQRHARGRISPGSDESEAPTLDIASAREQAPRPLPLKALYEKMERRGLHYGPAFRPIEEIQLGPDCFFATIDTGDRDLHQDGHTLHPTILDACLQPILYIARGENLYVPNGIRRVQFFGTKGTRFHAFGRLRKQTAQSLDGDVWIADEEGRAVAIVENVTCQSVDTEAALGEKNDSYIPEWEPEPLEPVDDPKLMGSALLIADEKSTDTALLESLQNQGGEVLRLNESGDLSSQILEALKRTLPEGGPILTFLGTIPCDSEDYEAILSPHQKFLEIARALQSFEHPYDLTVVTRNSTPGLDSGQRGTLTTAAFAALGTLAINESHSGSFRSIDLGNESDGTGIILNEISADSRGEIAWLRGERQVRRLKREPLPTATIPLITTSVDEPIALHPDAGRRIDGLGYRSAQRQEPGPGEVEIRVLAAGIGEKDTLKVLGKLSSIATRDTFSEDHLGLECMGEIVRTGTEVGPDMIGRKVIGFVPGAFCSHATVSADLLVAAPEGLGKAAAGISMAYVTATHALEGVASLRAEERVLILEASGEVGRAAVAVSRRIGATIFATADEDEAHDLEKTQEVRRVYAAGDAGLVETIRRDIGDEGFDVILSPSSTRDHSESLSLLRPGGRFIETGKRRILENGALPLRAFNENLLFASVDTDRLLKQRPTLIRELLEEMVGRFNRGEYNLPACREFPASAVHEAFEVAGKGHEKVILDFSTGTVDIPASTRIPGEIHRDGAYLITGGTSGFGLETAKWLAREGAGRIILLSRRGRDVDGLEESLTQISDETAEVLVEAGDVTDEPTLRRIGELMNSEGLHPAGVIHAAMVLDDAPLPEMTPERFERVMRPKVGGLLAIEKALPCSELDFLVLYSSISSLIGNRGQANYVAANGILDAMAQRLRKKGAPAISINWGALAETGVIARSANLEGILTSAGVEGLTNQEALRFLRRALKADLPHVAAFSVDWNRWKESHPALTTDTRFRKHTEQSSRGEEDPILLELRESIAGKTPEERTSIVERRLAEGLSTILKIPVDRIDSDSKLSNMGVDSLLLLELSLELKKRTGVMIPAMEFLKGPNIRDLCSVILSRVDSSE